MQCNCGAETALRSFKVNRATTAKSWTGIDWKQSQMPITISRQVCPACGRQGEITVKRGNKK